MEGDLPFNIAWSFEGMEIDNMNTDLTTINIGDKGSMLLIDSAKSHHAGKYTCTVKNPAGMSNFSAFLEINGNQLNLVFSSLTLSLSLKIKKIIKRLIIFFKN